MLCRLQRMDRVKVTDRFAFPLALNMAAIMGQQQAAAAVAGGGGGGGLVGHDGCVYDLEAILLHKGASATHGHYGGWPACGAAWSLFEG